MLDIRTKTDSDVIDAMILLDELATPAGDLVTGDRIVYRRNGVIHTTEVETVAEVGDEPADWVTVTTANGDAWKCSARNRGQYRLPR